MKTAKIILSVVLAMVIGLGCFSLITSAETSEILTEVPEGYIGIYTIEDLYCIRNNMTANYILMNDIDLTAATAESGDWSYGGRGWNPIGSGDIYGNKAFSGIFDGNGYMVKGMNINIKSTVPSGTSALYLGLFSNVSGTVRNLTISGSVSSEKSLTAYIGGIAGYCNSSAIFENCTNLVDIYCYNTSPIYAGGIVGYNNGSIYRCRNLGKIEISGSHTSGSSNRGYSFAAGIAGKTNQAKSIISECFNAGKIIAVSRGGYKRTESGGYYLNPQIYTTYYYADVHASGITSGGNGSVVNCYNIGNISATLAEDKAYASLNAAGISYDCQVSTSYNIAKSTGYSVGKSATKCYCTEDSGNLATGVTSLTAGQMKLKSMYSDWDFDSVWTMDGRKDYHYPELRNVRLLITKDDINHKHKYISEITTPATHTSTGIKTFTCVCGDTYTETIAKTTEHSYTSEITTPATHTSTGVMTYTCVCGDTYTETIAKTTEHRYISKITTPATHTSTGVMTYTCGCGDTYTEVIDKIAEHNHKAVVTKPTCTEQGYTTYTCECGDSYIDDYVAENGHDHKSEITTPATHTTTGVMTYTCHCGDTYTEVIDKIETHNHNAVVTEPTCTEKGYTTYTCECGDSYISNYKGATGHDYDSGIVTTKPTCTKTGIKTFTCANCGDTYTEEVSSLGHSYTSEITTPATHLSDGVETFTCGCGDTYTETIDKIATHNHIATITAPTCTEKGFTTYTCECGDAYVDDYVDATGHNHVSEITTPATHLTTGVMTYTCHCGDTYTEVIDKIATHNHAPIITAPTCTEQGYTTYACECGDSYVADYVDATGHSEGNKEGNCTACGEHICDHDCHKSGITGFFWKIVCFFNKLFGSNKFCECGMAHY